jgi:hypothetical protein
MHRVRVVCHHVSRQCRVVTTKARIGTETASGNRQGLSDGVGFGARKIPCSSRVGREVEDLMVSYLTPSRDVDNGVMAGENRWGNLISHSSGKRADLMISL